MRYYDLVVKASGESLEKNAKIKLREYCYDSPVGAFNTYIYRKLTNDITFFAYREDKNERLNCVFSYNEQKQSFDEVYGEIIDILSNIFGINKIVSGPEDITIFEYNDHLIEARRRDLAISWSRIIDTAHLWIYDYERELQENKTYFSLDERIIDKRKNANYFLFDESLKREIQNIDDHVLNDAESGNVVHYIVSGHSINAAVEITELLAERLLKANRINSRRIDIISEITPDCYKTYRTNFERVIENNLGGVVAFDLTERFGCNPVDYQLACKYIEKLVKTYSKDCLFVFLYNMDNPGFSYYLLPHLKNYVIPVSVREGSGDRKAAGKYLSSLIKSSDYSKYESQANEYMDQIQGDILSQTDVLEAFEKFGPWCMNKNIFQTYNYNIYDEFTIDRDEDDGSAYDRFQSLVGLEKVKEKVDRIISADLVEKERKKTLGKDYVSNSMHMIFAGDPGTAKTTTAKLFAGIAKEKGILKSGAFVECGGMDLNVPLPICTEIIRDAFKAAEGGVLFIDEAYALSGDTPVTVLIQEMENHRDSVIVILAGYTERMRQFMEKNEGLKSRIPYYVEFPNYNADELTDIFKLMLNDRHFTASDDAVDMAHSIFEKIQHVENFGNGRAVRNLIEKSIEKQSFRLFTEKGDVEAIDQNDLFHITKDDIEEPELCMRKDRTPGLARKELDEMIGLSNAKGLLRKAISFFKLRKDYLDKGIEQERAAMHMVFTGDPGTAKTTVARLMAEILKDEKILPAGQFIEVGRADLIGSHVGETAPKVRDKFREAQGGVLFIDEAYSLCDGYENSYGDEAINTIVQEMENHREDVVVIFAGYSEPMQEFLKRNPGLKSRIAFQVSFDNYSVEDLCDITRLMLSKKQMSITDAAIDKLRTIYENVYTKDDYGNGRFVRKILDEAEMNLADRIYQLDESDRVLEVITTIEECDIPDIPDGFDGNKPRIGFAV